MTALSTGLNGDSRRRLSLDLPRDLLPLDDEVWFMYVLVLALVRLSSTPSGIWVVVRPECRPAKMW